MFNGNNIRSTSAFLFLRQTSFIVEINLHTSLPALPQRTAMEPKTISSCLIFPEADREITFTCCGNLYQPFSKTSFYNISFEKNDKKIAQNVKNKCASHKI